ncbi:MAG: beta-N-acetylhexosaminidase [Deltaproteobacteria bacterium]|nr:beta-N-acetylhexosaminidase [Deltaproteobacteria bacterium]MBN2672746.1 beta-N-acetylhexosaminidase [Deltaproteobacteria bacterium]
MEQEYKELAGRTIIAGFEGTALPSYLASEIEAGELGGVILFSRNVESAEQVKALLDEIHSRAPEGKRPLISVDQEGGRVVRIREPLTVLPPALQLGKPMGETASESAKDAKRIYLAGKLVGHELRALGFSLNFAPVFDVNTNPDSPVIGDRSFGASPKEVVTYGLGFARGLRDGGVFPCAKHFPGHGDASVDSHLDLPTVHHDELRLMEIEVEPFAAWAKTGLGPIMTAHVMYPALDAAQPATMSRTILTGLLKERLHFDGAVITDDLEMGAITKGVGTTRAAVNTIRAGASGVLVCHTEALQHEVKTALIQEARMNTDFHLKLKKAVTRLAPLAYPAGPDIPFEWIGSDRHQRLREQVLGGGQ